MRKLNCSLAWLGLFYPKDIIRNEHNFLNVQISELSVRLSDNQTRVCLTFFSKSNYILPPCSWVWFLPVSSDQCARSPVSPQPGSAGGHLASGAAPGPGPSSDLSLFKYFLSNCYRFNEPEISVGTSNFKHQFRK